MKQVKMFLIITLLCLVIAATISLITGRVPSFVDKLISRQVARTIEGERKRLTKEVGEGLSQSDREKLKRALKRLRSGQR